VLGVFFQNEFNYILFAPAMTHRFEENGQPLLLCQSIKGCVFKLFIGIIDFYTFV